MNRLQKVLNRLRKNRSEHPPRAVREGNHVKVGGGKDPLKKNFKSSGTGDRECDHNWILEESGNQCDWVCTICGERDGADIVVDEGKKREVNLGTVRWMHQLVMQARSEMDSHGKNGGADEKLEKVQRSLHKIIKN